MRSRSRPDVPSRPIAAGAPSGLRFPERARIDLAGEWTFEPLARLVLEEGGSLREEMTGLPAGGTMAIPANWHLSGLKDFHGRVRFRREFVLDPGAHARPTWLCFRGVDYFADVALNGQYLGRHEGYFEPFEVEVTGLLLAGKNVLEVTVDAPHEEPRTLWPYRRRQIKGILNHWLPLERQMESTGGIWGAVYLEQRPEIQIRAVRYTAWLTPRTATNPMAGPWGEAAEEEVPGRRARLLAEVEFWCRQAGPVELEVAVGSVRSALATMAEAGLNRQNLVLTLEDPRLWWPWDLGTPHLYSARTVIRRGDESDACEAKVGVREVQFDRSRGEWRINGERFFLRGTNVIPDKWLAHYSADQIAEDIRLLRAAHVNGVRVCVHVTRDEFYTACDEAGILVWQDFPLQWQYALDDALVAEAIRQIRAMIRHLYNHPSIGLWTCQNEPEIPNRRGLDPILGTVARAADSSRYVSEASEFREHAYPGWYWAEMRDFVLLPGSPVVSEFGAQALPSTEEVRALVGDAWPPRGPAWVEHGFEPTMTLDTAGIALGKSLEEFVERSQAYQARLIQFAVERYRRAKYDKLGGFFHFMFMDGWPTIGWSVLSYARVPKKGYWALQRAFQPVLACTDPTRTKLSAQPDAWRVPLVREVWVVNDTHDPLLGCRVSVELRVPGGHLDLGEVTLDVPADGVGYAVLPRRWNPPRELAALTPGTYDLTLTVWSSDKRRLSENIYEVLIHSVDVDFTDCKR